MFVQKISDFKWSESSPSATPLCKCGGKACFSMHIHCFHETVAKVFVPETSFKLILCLIMMSKEKKEPCEQSQGQGYAKEKYHYFSGLDILNAKKSVIPVPVWYSDSVNV